MTLLESPGKAPRISLVSESAPRRELLARRGTYARRGKRVANLALLALVLPVAVVIALPIAVVNAILFRDPRRIFFRQERVGKHGVTFRVFKFRTMREVRLDAHFHSWSNGDDGLRVTSFGRLLRNTHLDELPQLINVLRGEMNFVGPRPEMTEVHVWACAEVPDFSERIRVRPGITGLAQVTQGYVTKDARDYERKLALDLDYIRSVSFLGDLSIVVRTLVWMLAGKGWRRAPRAAWAPRATGAESHARPAAGANRRAPEKAGVATIELCPLEPRAPVSSTIRSSSSTTPVRDTRSDRID